MHSSCLLNKDVILHSTKLIEFTQITQWLTEAINYLTNRQEQCSNKLKQHLDKGLCTLSTLNVDESLRSFVKLHHLDLKRSINHRTQLFRNQIREKTYEEQLYSHKFTEKQVCLFFSCSLFKIMD